MDDKQESDKPKKSHVDDPLTSDNSMLSKKKTVTKSDKPQGDFSVKSDQFRLPSAPKGISFCAVSYSSNNGGMDKTLQLKLADGVYKIDKIPDEITRSEFIMILDKNGFKPVYQTYASDDKKTRVDSYKFMHPDYSLQSENYTGNFAVNAGGNKHTLEVKNGIIETNNEFVAKALQSQGFELLGKGK